MVTSGAFHVARENEKIVKAFLRFSGNSALKMNKFSWLFWVPFSRCSYRNAMLFSDTEQQYGSLSRSLVWITLLLARSNYFHHILLAGMEEVEPDDSATSRSAHYLSTPVSQMWQANLWHLQVGFGTWPLLVRLLEGRSKASLRVYWESPARRYQRSRGCAR